MKECKFDTWYQDYIDDENKAVREAAKAAWNVQSARVTELEEMLLREVRHSAEQKLRADQMSQQHSTQAALNSEARSELAEVKAELAKAREVPEMPKPVMYGLFDNLGFYESRETSIACKTFCDHYNARDAKLGMECLAPYSYHALFTEDQVRAMFERNKG